MLFVLCGFEHSVANMFFIPMGMLLGANVTIGQLITNLIVVTIGNMIGGAILIPYMYNKDNKLIENLLLRTVEGLALRNLATCRK